MELIKRLDRYNLHYGFLEDSADFSFELHPERIIIRNDALRNNDRTLYEGYINNKFASHYTEAMQSFDASLANLVQLTKSEAASLLESHGVNLLQSDISIKEEDAIFTALVVPPAELPLQDENTKEKLIQNKALPYTVLDRPYIWLDLSLLDK
jgi:hypothetical protein